MGKRINDTINLNCYVDICPLSYSTVLKANQHYMRLILRGKNPLSDNKITFLSKLKKGFGITGTDKLS